MVEKESYCDHGLEQSDEKTRILSSHESSFHGSKSVEISKENSTNLTLKVPSRTRSSLVLFSCLFLQLTTFGINPAYGIIYVELIEVFQSSRAVAALVQSCYIGTSLGKFTFAFGSKELSILSDIFLVILLTLLYYNYSIRISILRYLGQTFEHILT